MKPFKLEFEYEESPASNNGIGLFITVWFHDVQMKYILDVDEFFKAIETAGISPLFTCSCGGFGCGGYFVEVIHEKAGMILKNSYQPLEPVDGNHIIDQFEFAISRGDIKQMGEQIVDIIEEIKAKWPGYMVFSGSYSELDLAERVADYQAVLQKIESSGVEI